MAVERYPPAVGVRSGLTFFESFLRAPQRSGPWRPGPPQSKIRGRPLPLASGSSPRARGSAEIWSSTLLHIQPPPMGMAKFRVCLSFRHSRWGEDRPGREIDRLGVLAQTRDVCRFDKTIARPRLAAGSHAQNPHTTVIDRSARQAKPLFVELR